MGAQGSGKGTVSEELSKQLGLPAISSGDAFKAVIKAGGELGKYVASFVDNGNLVPDDLTLKVVLSRLAEPDCKNGYILDGYPRTINQLKLMKGKIDVDKVIFLNIDRAEAINRLSGRVVCPKCGHIHNLRLGGDTKNCCNCGTAYIVRSDDTPEAINKRLDTYEAETIPVIEYFKGQGKVVEIICDASSTPEIAYKRVLKGLGKA